jgi:hypothetical protein
MWVALCGVAARRYTTGLLYEVCFRPCQRLRITNLLNSTMCAARGLREIRTSRDFDTDLFAALVFIFAVAFLFMEAIDRVETIRTKTPAWFRRIIERRESIYVLLFLSLVLQAGNGYELLVKEIPEVPEPPVVKINPPAVPAISITKVTPPIKEQCWVRNYGVPAISGASTWGMATIFCNTTIKPPYSVELHYDQSVSVGPFTFPIASEATKNVESNQGTKIVGMFELHTIIPNEPFSIMAQSQGSSDHFSAS